MQVTRGVCPAGPCLPRQTGAAGAGHNLPPHPTLSRNPGPAGPAAPLPCPTSAGSGATSNRSGCCPTCSPNRQPATAGATEAIMLRDGLVTEGSSTTVWVVDAQGVLRTHRLGHCHPPRLHPRLAAGRRWPGSGVAVEQRAVTEAELRAAREVFITSATSFVKPIVAVLDGKPRSATATVGPVTQAALRPLRPPRRRRHEHTPITHAFLAAPSPVAERAGVRGRFRTCLAITAETVTRRLAALQQSSACTRLPHGATFGHCADGTWVPVLVSKRRTWLLIK